LKKPHPEKTVSSIPEYSAPTRPALTQRDSPAGFWEGMLPRAIWG
jgi:hypothetical protein